MLDYNDKPAGYYANVRRELVEEVPPGTHSVLEIGCGEGATGAALKAEGRAIRVVGVELMEEAAAKARRVLDQVLVGNIEHMELPFEREQFDVFILADVLEHFVDPWTQLRRLMVYLKPGGLVIVSLPNVRNWRVVIPLIFQGKWEYQDSGVMDRTHLRFFTRTGMIQLFKSSGLEVLKATPLGQRSRRLARLPLGFLSEYATPQYLVVGVRKGI